MCLGASSGQTSLTTHFTIMYKMVGVYLLNFSFN